VKWRREQTGLHFAAAALRVDKKEAVEEFDFFGCAHATVKVVQIGAAAKRNVLAIINVLSIGKHVRGCAAAEERPLLEQAYTPAGLSQRDAGR
jgi:hypothetical protein